MIGKTTTVIKKAVNEFYDLQPGALEARDRRYIHVRARSVAVYLAYELTDYSPSQIGREMGGRDCCIIRYIFGTASKRIDREVDFLFEIEAVRLACLSALGRSPDWACSPDRQSPPPVPAPQKSPDAYSRRVYQPVPVLAGIPRFNITATLMGDPPACRSALSRKPKGSTYGNYSYTPELVPNRNADTDVTDQSRRGKPISRGRQARAYPH